MSAPPEIVRINPLRRAMKTGRPLYGFLSKLPSPHLVEIGRWAGFDFVIIDLEHSPIGIAETEQMVRAAQAAGIPALVRVPSPRSDLVAPVLDIGVDGVVAPMIANAAEARDFVASVRFPPSGSRGASPTARAVRYSVSFGAGNAYRAINEELLAWVLVESPQAIAAVDQIAAVPGVDVIWIGLHDLALALGVAPPTADDMDPAIRDAIDAVLRASIPHGVGVAASSAMPDLPAWQKKGLLLYYVGADISLFLRGCRDTLSALSVG